MKSHDEKNREERDNEIQSIVDEAMSKEVNGVNWKSEATFKRLGGGYTRTHKSGRKQRGTLSQAYGKLWK